MTAFLEKVQPRGQLVRPEGLWALQAALMALFLTLPDAKLIEGQVIELEDGTTAYIHQVTVQKGEDCQFTFLLLRRTLM